MKTATIEAAWLEGLRGHASNVHGGLVVPRGPSMGRLRHLRQDRVVDRLLEIQPARRIEGRFNYGGPIINHFGHFMVDTIHRVVPSMRAHPDRPFVFVVSKHDPAPLPFMWELWRHLGLAPPTLVHDNVQVDEVFVHQQGSNYMGTTHGAYLDMLDDLDRFRPENLPKSSEGRRVYVSRSALPGPPFILGERYLEGILAARGHSIFRPESHPFLYQIATYRAADAVVFGEGSAAHALELLGRGAVRTAFFYTRRPKDSERTRGMIRLLKLRSRELHGFRGNIYLGTLAFDARGLEREAVGTTAIHIPGLLDSLRDAGLLSDTSFSAADAIASTREDFLRYMAPGVKAAAPALAPADAEERLHRAFAEAMTAIYGASAARAAGL